MLERRSIMAKYMPGTDITDGNYVPAYGFSKAMPLLGLRPRQASLTQPSHAGLGSRPHEISQSPGLG